MSALGPLFTVLKALIAADSATAALLAAEPVAGVGVNGKAVYDDGAAPQPTRSLPMDALTPWVTVGAGTENYFGTHGLIGGNCTLQLKIAVQGSEALVQSIVATLRSLLFRIPRVQLTVPGFTTCLVDDFAVQPTLVTNLGGVVTRECPILLRVLAL